MDGYHHSGAGTHFLLNSINEADIDLDMNNLQDSMWTYQQDFPKHSAQIWEDRPSAGMKNYESLHQRHLSASTQSSTSSDWRSSDETLYHQWMKRDSTTSSASTLSNRSKSAKGYRRLATETHLKSLSSPLTSQTPSPVEEASSTLPLLLPNSRISHRQVTQERTRDPFATCVSRNQRSRRSSKPPKYFCTACAEPFVEKHDWKRHEQTYQERPEMFQCDMCNAVYFLEKDFLHHHVKCHRCQTCAEKGHVQSSRKPRMRRTAWGCGFCVHLSTSWRDRCKHIAEHFEKDGVNMSNWHHSYVIYSLLQQPQVLLEWNKIIMSKHPVNLHLGWNRHSTGRVEGFPESNPNPHLQDELEYYTPGQDAARIAWLAYKKAVKKREAPKSPGAPPVPPKDYGGHEASRLQGVANSGNLQTDWNMIASTIIDDTVLPQNVCMLEQNTVDDVFGRVWGYFGPEQGSR